MDSRWRDRLKSKEKKEATVGQLEHRHGQGISGPWFTFIHRKRLSKARRGQSYFIVIGLVPSQSTTSRGSVKRNPPPPSSVARLATYEVREPCDLFLPPFPHEPDRSLEKAYCASFPLYSSPRRSLALCLASSETLGFLRVL